MADYLVRVVARRNDQSLLKSFQALAADTEKIPEVKPGLLAFDGIQVGSDGTTNPEIKGALSRTHAVVQGFTLPLTFGQETGKQESKGSITLLREPDSFRDKVTFTWSTERLPPEVRLQIQSVVSKHLERSITEAQLDWDAGLEQLRLERVRLADTVGEVQTRIVELQAEAAEQLRQDRQRQQEESDAHRQKLDEDHADRLRAIEEREKELDATDAKSARRRNKREIVSKLAETQTKFRLSIDTERRRLWMLAPLVAGFLLSAAATVWSFYETTAAIEVLPSVLDPASGITPWAGLVLTLLRSTGLLVLTIGIGLYYLRWQDRWAERHAQEELRQRRLDLDIIRADWLIEAVQEQNEGGVQIPDQLISRLSEGLFQEPEQSREREQNLLAEALGDATELSLDVPMAKARFNRRALKRLSEN